MLTTAELNELRATQNLALPGSAVIQRYTPVADGMGGYDQTWAAVGTVAARLYPQNVRALAESTAGGAQVISETRWFLTLPYGTVITAKNRVKVGSRTWEIVAVNNSEMYQTAVRCEVVAFGEEERAVDVEPEPYSGPMLLFYEASNSMYLGVI
jgi:head-tail adaptor